MKILHFFNTPPSLTEEQLVEIFTQKEVAPAAVRMFPLKSERSSSGLLEFPSIAQAVLAIMKCNHTAIESKGDSLLLNRTQKEENFNFFGIKSFFDLSYQILTFNQTDVNNFPFCYLRNQISIHHETLLLIIEKSQLNL